MLPKKSQKRKILLSLALSGAFLASVHGLWAVMNANDSSSVFLSCHGQENTVASRKDIFGLRKNLPAGNTTGILECCQTSDWAKLASEKSNEQLKTVFVASFLGQNSGNNLAWKQKNNFNSELLFRPPPQGEGLSSVIKIE